jgi:ATP-binding cassette subfamily B (MDR/TAP) protein 1
MWTYTGERQTLRIRQKFVHSALRQDASWFDRKGDAQELPIIASNALSRINKAIGREIGDATANLFSGVGSLAVAVGLDAPLALFMICMLPIVAVGVAIVSCYMRKSSKLALEAFGSAGAFAIEVISGIKTVSSLCAERWALSTYETHAREAQKHSIRSQFYSKLAAGIMGFLFYVT